MVFASKKGLSNLTKKVREFRTEDRPDRTRTESDGSTTIIPGRPKNADLVQGIAQVAEATLKDLWLQSPDRFPSSGQRVAWEVWIDRTAGTEDFMEQARALGADVDEAVLEFPEQYVIKVIAPASLLGRLAKDTGSVVGVAKPGATADFFDGLSPPDQRDWLEELRGRVRDTAGSNKTYVTLLDTGVGRQHPLVSPFLHRDDRHSAEPAWGVEDTIGHGTMLAGLALMGDLTDALQTTAEIEVGHHLESSKIIPPSGSNPYHLLGVVTRKGVDVAETSEDRRRIFQLATSTSDDTPHSGAPTSWSTEVDQLASGKSGLSEVQQRLFVISAGNTDNNLMVDEDYLAVCDDLSSELESPAHAWNAVAVGGFTNKTNLSDPTLQGHSPLAPTGDLSPWSRTASWIGEWPIKPDIVLEAGNLALGPTPPALQCQDLSLLTVDPAYPQRVFTTTWATSAATALAARMSAQIWSAYPDLWPETVRALLVASARWTSTMRGHVAPRANKEAYSVLFKRYGYGCPSAERAIRSASSDFTLIVEDELQPYTKEGSADPIHNEMKVHQLPWPIEGLRRLGTEKVRLRVALSTFVEPNPAEAARGSKLRYASHGLRFKLIRPNEDLDEFRKRINKAAISEGETFSSQPDDDGWTFGSTRRDVGSLHVDEMELYASELARRGVIAVHPVSGWWKTRPGLNRWDSSARYALVIMVDAGDAEIDLHAEVENKITVVT